VDEVIGLIGLEEKRDTRARRLSGGQRRRLDLGLALVGYPELIFLDEPTTGFDPGARRRAWETIRSLSGLGKTILLTTHYLDEVEQLADRVAVLREGRIVASGTDEELVGGAPATEIRYRRHELRGQLRLYGRSRELAFFTFALPLIMFFLLGSVYGNDRIKSEGNVRGADYLLSGMLGYGAIATGFAGLSIMLVIRRESGI